MTKWEYVEVQVVSSLSGPQGEATMFKPDGSHIKRTDKFGLLLAQLGLEGWELVAACMRQEGAIAAIPKMNYTFKRAVKEG
jgi:hypothetical protein